MGDYRLQAFIDIKADPVGTTYVQTSRCIDEYAPKLAEKCGLGEMTGHGHTRYAVSHIKYENGAILVHRESRGGLHGGSSYGTGA